MRATTTRKGLFQERTICSSTISASNQMGSWMCIVYFKFIWNIYDFLRILVLPPFVLNPCPSCCYTNTQYKYIDCSAMAKESFRIRKGLRLSLLLRQTRSIDTLVAMSCLSVRSCKQTIPRRVYQKCGTEVAV